MLRLSGVQLESLWDEVLPVQARELPEDLARLDELLTDPGPLPPIRAHWQREADGVGRAAGAGAEPPALRTCAGTGSYAAAACSHAGRHQRSAPALAVGELSRRPQVNHAVFGTVTRDASRISGRATGAIRGLGAREASDRTVTRDESGAVPFDA
jgi:hypothetical protein